jgi:hypothetical protein
MKYVSKCLGCNFSWSTNDGSIKCSECNCEDITTVPKTNEHVEANKAYKIVQSVMSRNRLLRTEIRYLKDKMCSAEVSYIRLGYDDLCNIKTEDDFKRFIIESEHKISEERKLEFEIQRTDIKEQLEYIVSSIKNNNYKNGCYPIRALTARAMKRFNVTSLYVEILYRYLKRDVIWFVVNGTRSTTGFIYRG